MAQTSEWKWNGICNIHLCHHMLSRGPGASGVSPQRSNPMRKVHDHVIILEFSEYLCYQDSLLSKKSFTSITIPSELDAAVAGTLALIHAGNFPLILS